MKIETIDLKSFQEDLNGAMNSVIQKISRDNFYNWKEDYITYEFLPEYRKRFQNIEIRATDKKVIKLQSSAYKLGNKLRAEHKFGDIALIIKIVYLDTFSGSLELEGVAFLEAKRRDENKCSFSAIKYNQLERIYQYAPHAHLLLYDYENIYNDYNYNEYKLRNRNNLINHPKSLYAVTLPINIAIGSKLKDTQLYRFSVPFSHQIITRYFCGLDLDFSPESLKIAKGYNRDTGAPKFLLRVSIVVSYSGQDNIEQSFDEILDIREYFEEI